MATTVARPKTIPSSLPSTPVASVSSTPQTGTWIHPRFAEIARRQNASTFNQANVSRIARNGLLLFALFVGERFIHTNVPGFSETIASFQPYPSYIYTLIRIVLFANIIIALLPLIRKRDDLADIPLTPGQRKLLGLPALDTPPTPGSTYITPPRYARTPPLSGSPSSSPRESSPLAGRGSGGNSNNSSINDISVLSRNSSFSPNASPLLQKAVNGSSRRSSYGSPSPLGPNVAGKSVSIWDASTGAPGTPSPVPGKPPSVGLNNKWLYDRGRSRTSSGGSTSLFS